MSGILLRTVEDYQHFYIHFYGRNKNVIDDLLDYREYRLMNTNITLDSFKEMCHNSNMLDVFEEVFLQSFTTNDINLVRSSITNGTITLDYLYDNFQANVNKNIMKYVL